MAKRGRKKLEIDGEEVKKLAAIGCTMLEVANHFGCVESTISMNFRSEFKLASQDFKNSLRRLQYERARRGSDSMLIHLGKNYLGQSDKVESKVKLQADVDLKTREKEYHQLWETWKRSRSTVDGDSGEQPLDSTPPDSETDRLPDSG